MNIAKIVWAMVSAGLAFGLNLHLRPNFQAAYEREGQPQSVEGALTLGDPALEISTTGVRIVVEDQEHMRKEYKLRELSLRSQNGPGSVPSCELFITLPSATRATPGEPVDARSLLQLELPLQPLGRLGSRESFVQRDETGPGRVITGSWQFTDMRENWDTGSATLQADARVELQIETASGVRMLTGKWTGRIIP